MELRHLRYFATIVEANGFGRAAVRLRVAQPTLSRQMHELEKELGVTLLQRHARGIALTEAGAAIHACAVRTVHEVRQAAARALAAAEGRRGRCIIGAGRPAIWSGAVRRGVAEVQQRFPEIELVVQEVEGNVQWGALAAGELDIGIGITPPASQVALDSAILYYDAIECVLLPAEHPLAASGELTAQDLRDLPLIRMPPALADTGLMAPLDRALERIGCTSRRVHQPHSIQSLWLLVAAGQGWSVAPASFLQRAPDGTRAVPLRGMHVPISFSVVWRRGETRPVVRRVRDVFVEQGVEAARGSGHREPSHLPRALKRADPCPELRLLRTLGVVVEARSLGRAAERLRLTQSTVSRQIRDLENQLGASVVERLSRGIEPTPAGKSLAADVPTVVKCVDELLATAARERGGNRRCALGVVTAWSAKAVLDGLFHSFGARKLDLQIAVEEMPSYAQPAALLARAIDIGLSHAFPPGPGEEAIARELLVSDPIDGALFARGHPLAGRRQLRGTDLAQVPFLFMQRAAHPRFFDFIMDSLRRAGVEPLTDGAYDGLSTVWSIAMEGRGWAAAFHSHRRHPPPGLKAIPIEGLSIPFGLEVLWRREETRPAVLEVLHLVRAWPRSGVPGRH